MTVAIALPGVLESLPSISLADLQDEAAYLTRKDRKYVLPASDVETMLDGIADEMRVLEIDGQRLFGYRTPYFDDHELTAYFKALGRRPSRFKVRTRLYEDSGLRLLEVKLRDGRGRTVKHRREHEAACLERLSEDECAWLGEFPEVADHAERLRHCLTTFYRRTTLMLPGGAGRITIDRDLMFCLPDGQGVALPTLAIVETKGPGKATVVDRRLWRCGHRPTSISKFTMGLGLLTPDLRANRWHRLRNQLSAIAEPTTLASA